MTSVTSAICGDDIVVLVVTSVMLDVWDDICNV